MLLEAIEPIEDTKDFNIHKDTCFTLASHTHTHTHAEHVASFIAGFLTTQMKPWTE